MFERFAASFMALAMLITSGMFGGTAYLCLMDGQTRSECCCKKSQTEADDDCAKVERANRCCEVSVTTVDHQTARVEVTRHQLQLSPVLAVLPSVTQVQRPAILEVELPPGARGPPPGSGPPLFVRNCSYLI